MWHLADLRGKKVTITSLDNTNFYLIGQGDERTSTLSLIYTINQRLNVS
jgi:hypothetical protein